MMDIPTTDFFLFMLTPPVIRQAILNPVHDLLSTARYKYFTTHSHFCHYFSRSLVIGSRRQVAMSLACGQVLDAQQMDHTRAGEQTTVREEKVRSISVAVYLDRDGFEDVEAIESRADDHARYLWMPMHLLDIFLSLMDEKQLGRDILQLGLCVCVPRRYVFGIFLNG